MARNSLSGEDDIRVPIGDNKDSKRKEVESIFVLQKFWKLLFDELEL